MTARVRQRMGITVFDAALDRLTADMAAGHRLVVSFSAGKDSTVVLQMALMAAKLTDYGPLDVVLRDEEAAFPGTYEYAERVAQRPDVRMTWLVAPQPILNLYNRHEPYWWAFDPLLPRSAWMRDPPTWGTPTNDLPMESNTTPERFPVQPGQELRAVVGLRVQESRGRMYGLFSSNGHLTKPNRFGVRTMRPIYDMTDADVWRFISEQKCDYNKAYDIMRRLGVPARRLRIAPPTMNMQGAATLRVASQAWPNWFNKLCERCPGVRSGAMFGRDAVIPHRRQGETWQECFYRNCVEEAPDWVAARATKAITDLLRAHARHSTQPLPEIEACYTCEGSIGAWKPLALALYNGDPFSSRVTSLPYIEPEFFRPGTGKWNGKPSF